MKHIIKNKLYIAMTAILLSDCALAGPIETLEESWYIGGAVGQSRLQPEGGDDWDVSDKTDFSKKVYGGVNIGRDFGLEAFWNDLGAAKVTSNKTGEDATVKYRAYGGNLVYHVPSYLGDLHPIVKLGVAKVDTKGDGVGVNQKNKFDVMAGVGAEYQLQEGFRVRAEYERFDKDIDQLSLGLNWRPVLTRRAIEAPKPAEPPRPIVIVNQQPQPAPEPIIKTVVKHVPSPPIVKTVVKHVPSPPVVKTVVKHVPSPPIVKTVVKTVPVEKTIVKHIPAPQPVVNRVVVNNPAPAKPKPQPKVVHKTLAGGSNFATNSASLTNAGKSSLNRMASDLLRDKVVIHNIAIIGHTDNVGSHAANQTLSQRRAESVANYLASRGLNRGLMTVVGRGETQPTASNASAAGRAQNRRVNIVVKGSQTIQR